MTGRSRNSRGQALAEYVLLLLFFASTMLVLSQIMSQGFANAYESFVGVMQWPIPF